MQQMNAISSAETERQARITSINLKPITVEQPRDKDPLQSKNKSATDATILVTVEAM